MSKAEALIPENVQAFARAFTALAKEHKLGKASITLSFGYGADREWDEPIHISWEDGRHGAAAREFFISTTLTIRGKVPLEPIR